MVESPTADRIERHIFAFIDKRQNVSTGSSNPQMYLMGTTRLDLLSYMLFGAYRMELTDRGIDCDEWLPIVGKVAVLNDIQRLKTLMEACMLRVFEGVSRAQRSLRTSAVPSTSIISSPRYNVDAESDESDDDSQRRDRRLSQTEVKELDFLTRDIVNILNGYSEERLGVQSTKTSPPGTCSCLYEVGIHLMKLLCLQPRLETLQHPP